MKLEAPLVALFIPLACWGQSVSTGAVRVFGTGAGGQDRVRIQVDDTASGSSGNRPADVGASGFSVDFWVRGVVADNTSAARGQGSYPDFNWIEGNTVVDRDIWASGNNAERDWGISFAGGFVAFGTGNGQGPAGSQSLLAGGGATDSLNTIHGDTPVLDGAWRHVAITRDYVTGAKRIYVDGVLDFEAVGVSNDDLSFPDAGVAADPSSKDNNFLVLGAEKHDAGAAYPSFAGFLDEVRVWRRALSASEVAGLRGRVLPGFYPGLAGYWRFEETSGTTVGDSAVVGPFAGGSATSSPGVLVNNTAGNGLRVFSSANASHTAPVSIEPRLVQLAAVRLAANGTFTSPIFATFAPGEPDRLYIVEQGAGGTGNIRIFNLATNTVLPTAFLSVSGLAGGQEEGLLGLAFHPEYQTNRAFYVYLTNGAGNNEVRRYFRDAGNPDLAVASSGQTVLALPHPSQSNHNGGWIAFGLDGFLYIATGDGGGGNDPANNAQNLNSLNGKLLRIQPGATANSTYGIPSGNPFASVAGLDEIWAYGLRNPWRCSFDRGTGDLWIGDVGQLIFEEVNRLPAGSSGWNFGWRPIEGFADTPGVADAHPAAAVPPVADYGRSVGQSITGGYVYRGGAISGFQGHFLYADFLSNTNNNGRVFSLRLASGVVAELVERTAELDPSPGGTTPSIRSISSFAEDAHGELYVLDRGDGELFKIVSASSWDVWRSTHFTRAELADPALSGETADPDGDRMANLFEYAAGRLPRTPELPPLTLATEQVDGQSHLTLTFDRASVSGVTAVGEVSSDVGVTDPWTAAVTMINTPAQLKVRTATPLSVDPAQFLRIRVTRP